MMHMLVDLKICEACGSLMYRATGGTEVYCRGCAVKLGEFSTPRARLRPGGRRKQPVMPVALFRVPAGGGE